jgi:Flp pilus assembly pilin Flp
MFFNIQRIFVPGTLFRKNAAPYQPHKEFNNCMIKRLFLDTSAELDEKALLIALFVIAAIVTLSPLGEKVAETFKNIAAAI